MSLALKHALSHCIFMHFIISILSLLLISPALAQDFTLTSAEVHRDTCISNMGLTEQQLATHLYDYQVERCVEFSVHQEGSQQRLDRLRLRQERRNERSRAVARARAISSESLYRFDPSTDARGATASSMRRNILEQDEQFSYQEARECRALIRRERAQQSREECRDSPRSFYPNCVRNAFRALGSEEISLPGKCAGYSETTTTSR